MNSRLAKLFLPLLLSSTAFAQQKFDGSYYDQFVFNVIGQCPNPLFRATTKLGPIRLGTDDLGRDVEIFDFALQLFSDGQYFLEYTEGAVVERDPNGGIWYEPKFSRNFEGQWRDESGALVLSDVGRAVPAAFERSGVTSPGFTFKLDHVLNDARALDVAINMVWSWGNTGPRGASINEFCNNPLL